MDEKSLSKLKVADLKAKLKKSELPLDGTKAELIRRLLEHEEAKKLLEEDAEGDLIDPGPKQEPVAYTLPPKARPQPCDFPEFPSGTFWETLKAIPYDFKEEVYSQDALFELAIECTNLSFADLPIFSPYAGLLYESEEFWRYRWHRHHHLNPSSDLPRLPSGFRTWKAYSLYTTPTAYVIASQEGKLDEIEKFLWRTLANASARVTHQTILEVPLTASRTFLGRLTNGMTLSFVNYPGSPLSLFAELSHSDYETIPTTKTHLETLPIVKDLWILEHGESFPLDDAMDPSKLPQKGSAVETTPTLLVSSL